MIRLENVTKYYPTRMGRHYVLRDVSFDISQGAQMGVLGRNGAGKTTLLRLLAGVDIPNSGRIIRKGHISWPLGIGAGVQSSMTGRENARFCCRIQGMRGNEIPAMVEHMRKFAELGKFFDLPAKTYSSGMKARLKFAMAMSFEFDCYIIDELSAVGDASFRNKSKKLFQEKRARSSFIRVSHGLDELLEECNCGVVIENGALQVFDSIEAAVDCYKSIIGDTDEASVVRGGRKWKQAAKEVLAAAGSFEEAAASEKKTGKSAKQAARRTAKQARRTAKGEAPAPRKKRRRTRVAAAPAIASAPAAAHAPAPAALGGPMRSSYRPAPMAPRTGGGRS
jgi:capsular polysaccharide transport system ATP-binding protein